MNTLRIDCLGNHLNYKLIRLKVFHQTIKFKGNFFITSPIDGRISGLSCTHKYAALAIRYTSYVSYESPIRRSMSSCSASLWIIGSAYDLHITDID